MTLRIFNRELSAAKAFESGTHRTRPPSETYADLKRFFSHFGITRVANLAGLDTIDLPVYTAIRPNSRSLATSQGKGLDRDAARVSAVMESIECWHAEHIVASVRIDSYARLRRIESVVDVEGLHCVRSPSQILPYAWLAGHDLVSGEACFVPYDAVSINRVIEAGAMSDFLPSTNGLASGNHVLEAIAHGLCEVIERDATALWQIGGELKGVDLDDLANPYCREVVARIRRGGVHVVAWDTTSDVGIPTYTAMVIDRPEKRLWRPLGVYYGVGTHLAPEIALSRALTEAVQSRVGFISGSRDDLFRSRYRWLTNEDFVRAIWAEIEASPPTVKLTDRPSLSRPSFEEDIAVLVERLQERAIERVIAVDLTQESIGIPVVKVLVPGLEGPGMGERPGPRARAARAAS